MKIEICIDNIESALIAEKAGASRLELCACLAVGGITPSYSLIKSAVELCQIPCYVMIRPRAGDFLFSEQEIQMMEQDIKIAKQLGAKGVVIGALTTKAELDLACCERLIKAADGLGITFHRAFDLCQAPQQALEKIIHLGCERVLTSGQKITALAGTNLIKELVEQANGRISIMAGSGINSDNVIDIIQQTGIQEVHLSAKTYRPSQMQQYSQAIMGNQNIDDQQINIADFIQIQQIKNKLQQVKVS